MELQTSGGQTSGSSHKYMDLYHALKKLDFGDLIPGLVTFELKLFMLGLFSKDSMFIGKSALRSKI
jgi:hypothetical protein